MPKAPEWSELVLARCTAAEHALEHALRTGFQATGGDIARAWPEAHAGETAPGAIHDQWRKTLEPAIQAGRVILSKAGRHTYYTFAGFTHIAIPRPSRQFGPELEARSLRAEAAIRTAAERSGTMVDGRALTDAWKKDFGSEDLQSDSWSRILEPAIALGRIRVETFNGARFYAPSDRPELRPPRWHSDLVRAEEAVRRATDRLRSAVFLDRVRMEIEEDPELRLYNSKILPQTLQSLVGLGRVRLVRPFAREAGGRLYYALQTGPNFVRSEAEHPLDKRWRALLSLWRATGGVPCTTQALRRYAGARASFQIDGDPPYAWTNALHHLENNGDVVRVDSIGGRWVLWAPAAPWNSLSAMQRADKLQRLSDRFADPAGPFGGRQSALIESNHPSQKPRTGSTHEASKRSPTAMPAGGIDSGFISHGQNLRALVGHAKVAAGEGITDPVQRSILESRPVRIAQVRKVALQHPLLQSRRGIDLGRALREATRLRDGMVRAPVARIGRVANYWLYDLERTAEGEQYVDFLHALWRMRWYAGTTSRSVEQRLSLLDQAWEQSISRSIPVGRPILEARAQQLAREVGGRRTVLERAAGETRLLDHEAEKVQHLLHRASSIEARVERLVGKCMSAEDYSFKWTPEWVVDTTHAYTEVTGVAGFELDVARRMSSRFSLVDTVTSDQMVETAPSRSKGRGKPVTTWLDRVAFALYAATRWGGSYTATVAHQAWHALGDLRDPEPVIATLRAPEESPAHLGAAAALAFMDTSTSRAALQAYLRSALREVNSAITNPVAEIATFGLGINPFGGFATSLLDEEHEVLEQVAQKGDARIAWMASRSIQVWQTAPGDSIRYTL